MATPGGFGRVEGRNRAPNARDGGVPRGPLRAYDRPSSARRANVPKNRDGRTPLFLRGGRRIRPSRGCVFGIIDPAAVGYSDSPIHTISSIQAPAVWEAPMCEEDPHPAPRACGFWAIRRAGFQTAPRNTAKTYPIGR